ncbi:hypothetical protein CsSME_00005220 [Camellia sinensis var. sinensis]
MSISPNSQWRGCTTNFPQLVNEEDERAAQFWQKLFTTLTVVLQLPLYLTLCTEVATEKKTSSAMFFAGILLLEK